MADIVTMVQETAGLSTWKIVQAVVRWKYRCSVTAPLPSILDRHLACCVGRISACSETLYRDDPGTGDYVKP